MIPLITGQEIAFWVLAPLTILGALGMILSRKPVHSALSLAGMMVALGALYASMDAPFLFVAQIIVYTGAIMMLFMFTMMIIGIDSVDSLVETIRGQRVWSIILVAAFAALLILAVGRGIIHPVEGGMESYNARAGGNVMAIAGLLFGLGDQPGRFIFPFLLTAALLIVAGVAAVVLAQGERLKRRESQAEISRRTIRAYAQKNHNPAPLAGPGVYARHNSIDYPALLPDGSVEESSVSPTLNIRGVAIVENDGLRSVHASTLGEYAETHDEIDGTNLADEVADALDDSPSAGTDVVATRGETVSEEEEI